jgi:hypothetical protein
MKSITQTKNEAGIVTETITTETDQDQNSIKVAKNGKGEFSWEIKVYGKNSEDIKTELHNSRKVADAEAQ